MNIYYRSPVERNPRAIGEVLDCKSARVRVRFADGAPYSDGTSLPLLGYVRLGLGDIRIASTGVAADIRNATKIFVFFALFVDKSNCKAKTLRTLRLCEAIQRSVPFLILFNLENQAQRVDERNIEDLEILEWNVIVIWECELKDPDEVMRSIKRRLNPQTAAYIVRPSPPLLAAEEVAGYSAGVALRAP